jgi:serine/threonine protein kinase
LSSNWLTCPRCQVLIPVKDSAPTQCPACAAPLAGGAAPASDSTWFYAQNRQKHGPVAWPQLQKLAHAGTLRPEAMLLRSGTQKWVAASSLAGLFPTADAAYSVTVGLAEKPTDADTPKEAGSPLPLPSIRGYEVLSELGRGGMGVVYKARQLGLNRLVALKMILAGAHAGSHEQARFRAEAEAVARLQHSNIVQIHEVGEQEGRPFFSLEYVDGGSLDRKIAGAPQPIQDSARMVAILARAVHYAHEHSIVHRDLKPANVLLTKDGQPKIADFGLAKHLDASGGDTRSGAILGTPSYAAPEQAGGKTREVGPPTDVYALGAILYEMLTGVPPFRGETPLDTILAVISQEPVPPRKLRAEVPRDLETICLKCLNKSPAHRYRSAQALAEELERFQNGEPILARPAGDIERAWRWCRRYPIPATLLVVVSVLLIVVTLGSGIGLWHLSRLSERLVRSTAMESAAQETEILDELNNFYSARVVDRVKPFGVKATNDYAASPGTIPLPATLTIDLGNHISEHSQRGMQVRLYSDHPFRSRENGGPQDDFERYALETLREHPDRPVVRFEKIQGRPVLRYATARVMKESCVKCHNEHPDSTKRDWKVNDVRGVVEIVRPLDGDETRTRDGLRGTYTLIAAISIALFVGLTGIVLGVGWWARGYAQARAQALGGDSTANSR